MQTIASKSEIKIRVPWSIKLYTSFMPGFYENFPVYDEAEYKASWGAEGFGKVNTHWDEVYPNSQEAYVNARFNALLGQDDIHEEFSVWWKIEKVAA